MEFSRPDSTEELQLHRCFDWAIEEDILKQPRGLEKDLYNYAHFPSFYYQKAGAH